MEACAENINYLCTILFSPFPDIEIEGLFLLKSINLFIFIYNTLIAKKLLFLSHFNRNCM